MKKLFTLLTMLLLGIGSMWADKVQVTLHDQTEKEGIDNTAASSEATADHKYGSYSGSDVANIPYYTTFTTNATSGVEGLTLSTTSKILKPTYVPSTHSEYGHVMAIWYDKTDNTTVHTFTLTAPNGYYIKTYSFKAISTSDSGGFTISAGGNNYTVKGKGSTLQTIANEVYAPTTTFTVQRNTTNNNSTLCIYSFTVVLGTIGENTWNSGIESSSINNHYSNVWYLKLTSPTKDDVFFNTFSLSHRASNSADDDIETYLAFTYNTFNDQLNHQANEFIAISSNSLSGHSSNTAVVKEYTFSETVRINGNTDVYACFVSKNNDGTYSLRKRGLGVTGGGSISISSANNYTTSINNYAYTPYYSCTYTTSYVYPQTNSEYHIWWKNNVNDKTTGGKITISAIKMTTPGITGQYVHFDRFSILLRDADVTQNTYLLFSKTFLLGSNVTTDTEFDPSNFTAVSTNYVPSANYGKVFDFQFDSNQYLDGNNTYYVYMGIKKENGNFCLRQYGIFINHQYYGNNTGFTTYQYLTTTSPNTQNTWCPIWYSNKCQFADSKIALNIKEADKTIRTRTIYANDDVDVKTALNIPSVFTVTPASITHSAGATSQDVNINASFVPSSAPAATEGNHIYLFKLHGKYAGGVDGKTLSASTDMSENDQWVIGGNYYDGYTFYNVGQAKYLSVQNSDNSQGTFVAESSSASKFIAGTNSTGFGFRLLGSRFCYLNDNAGNNVLSTWKNASAATDDGSRITVEPCIVTYNLKFGGSTIATKTVDKVTGDSEDLFPSEWERDFCTYSYEPAEIGNSTTSVDVTMTWDGPFDISADFASAIWYYMKSNNTWVFYDSSDESKLPVVSTIDEAKEKGDAALWAFVGDPYNGVQVVNKAKGSGYYIDVNNNVVMVTSGYTVTQIANEGANGFSLSNEEYSFGSNSAKLILLFSSSTDRFLTVRSYYCQQALDDLADYAEANAVGQYFGVRQESIDAVQGIFESMPNMSQTDYETYAVPEGVAMYLNIKKPTTGYYRIKNNGTGNYLAYGTPTANGKTPSAGLIATSNNTDAASIIKLTGSAGTYKLSVQGLNIQSQTSGNVAFPGSDAEGVDFVFNVSTPGVVSITNAASASATVSYRDGSLHEGTDGWTVHGVINWSASNPNSKWVVEDATGFDVAMNGPVDGNYYATLCVPFDVTISDDDATAYTLAKSESGNYLVPTEVEGNQVPAGTPVLLKGTNSTATATINTGSAFGSPLTCALTGTYVAKTIVGSSDYVLGKKDGKVGFYHWNSNNLGANRAYLEATTDQARGFVLNFDDEATGIVAPTADTAGESTIYNLSGQRLNKMQKGINIVNGKKVLF